MGGGVAGAIRKKGGKIIEEEAVKKGPIKIGEAIETSAGALNVKYVIHAATVGLPACRPLGISQKFQGLSPGNSMNFTGQAGIFKTDEVKIRQSCANSLKLAEKLKLKSIAFPALGCGVGGFSLVAAAKIMAQEVFKHLREDNCGLSEIIFCLYNDKAYQVFQNNITRYLEYIQHKLSKGPFTTIDAIIELKEGIVLIQRSNPPFGWALPGGFVDYGESLEDAVKREAKEETNMDLVEIEQFHTYSDPKRDPRFHTVGTIFIAKAKGRPKAGDDAKGLKIVKYEDLLKLDYAFDHKKIIKDYLEYKKTKDR